MFLQVLVRRVESNSCHVNAILEQQKGWEMCDPLVMIPDASSWISWASGFGLDCQGWEWMICVCVQCAMKALSMSFKHFQTMILLFVIVSKVWFLRVSPVIETRFICHSNINVDPETAKTNWQENAKLELQVDSKRGGRNQWQDMTWCFEMVSFVSSRWAPKPHMGLNGVM